MMLLMKEPEGFSATTKPVVVSDVSVLKIHLHSEIEDQQSRSAFYKQQNENQMYYMKQIILFQAA